jgi:hypothetical protein
MCWNFELQRLDVPKRKAFLGEKKKEPNTESNKAQETNGDGPKPKDWAGR